MAERLTKTPEALAATGLIGTYAAPTAEGISIPGDGETFLHVKNVGAEMTVTVQTHETRAGLAVAEQVVTIAATTGEKFIGPFKPVVTYNRASSVTDPGAVWIDFSRITDVTYAVIGF